MNAQRTSRPQIKLQWFNTNDLGNDRLVFFLSDSHTSRLERRFLLKQVLQTMTFLYIYDMTTKILFRNLLSLMITTYENPFLPAHLNYFCNMVDC